MFRPIHNISLLVGYCSVLVLFFLLQGCGAAEKYYQLPVFASDTTVNAVIEIPAGTNKKYEYNATRRKFEIDKKDSIERVIDFLPYPANYGFIPSTLSDPGTGGDGDALDVLVISEAVKTGTVIESHPVAVLKLTDKGEEDYKIIAVPADTEFRIISAMNFNELSLNYPGLIRILEAWFLNYNKTDPARIEGWGDERKAMAEIKKHLKNQ
jgi:inorganic pyrophosphatase